LSKVRIPRLVRHARENQGVQTRLLRLAYFTNPGRASQFRVNPGSAARIEGARRRGVRKKISKISCPHLRAQSWKDWTMSRAAVGDGVTASANPSSRGSGIPFRRSNLSSGQFGLPTAGIRSGPRPVPSRGPLVNRFFPNEVPAPTSAESSAKDLQGPGELLGSGYPLAITEGPKTFSEKCRFPGLPYARGKSRVARTHADESTRSCCQGFRLAVAFHWQHVVDRS
jgi:hypothetical protein